MQRSSVKHHKSIQPRKYQPALHVMYVCMYVCVDVWIRVCNRPVQNAIIFHQRIPQTTHMRVYVCRHGVMHVRKYTLDASVEFVMR
jgi:hypothetical protein